MRIIVDAMGSDHGPAVPIGAAVELVSNDDYDITLVGVEQQIRDMIPARLLESGKLQIADAPETLNADTDVVKAIRRNTKASIPIGLQLARENSQDYAFVSGGNTGAVVAAATLILGRGEGVDRPGIGVVFPTLTDEYTLMLDAGAVVDPRARCLFQYGLMGAAYVHSIYGYPKPRVGLLSNGEEASKGNRVTREAHELLSQSDQVNFKGNVEGRDLVAGAVDVIVTDGFTGNVALKTAEGTAQFVQYAIRQELTSRWYTKLLAGLLRPAFRRVGTRLDYREQGGAPLLGVNGTVIIAHGSSDVGTFKNAVRTAHRSLERGVINQVSHMISQEPVE